MWLQACLLTFNCSPNNAYWFLPKIFAHDWHLRHTWPVTGLLLTPTKQSPFTDSGQRFGPVICFRAQLAKSRLAPISVICWLSGFNFLFFKLYSLLRGLEQTLSQQSSMDTMLEITACLPQSCLMQSAFPFSSHPILSTSKRSSVNCKLVMLLLCLHGNPAAWCTPNQVKLLHITTTRRLAAFSHQFCQAGFSGLLGYQTLGVDS